MRGRARGRRTHAGEGGARGGGALRIRPWRELALLARVCPPQELLEKETLSGDQIKGMLGIHTLKQAAKAAANVVQGRRDGGTAAA